MSATKPATLAEALARIEELEKRDRDAERQKRRHALAGFYAVYLRQQGLSPEEAARAVIEKYPHTHDKLASFAFKPK
jgi:hypothetical protein